MNVTGNILHPRTVDFAVLIEENHITPTGDANITGNVFIGLGLTSGGIINPAGADYNGLPEYNIQSNQGIADNTPTEQATIDNFTGTVTTISAASTPVKINFGNTIRTSSGILFSSRQLVTDVTDFEDDQIIPRIKNISNLIKFNIDTGDRAHRLFRNLRRNGFFGYYLS